MSYRQREVILEHCRLSVRQNTSNLPLIWKPILRRIGCSAAGKGMTPERRRNGCPFLFSSPTEQRVNSARMGTTHRLGKPVACNASMPISSLSLVAEAETDCRVSRCDTSFFGFKASNVNRFFQRNSFNFSLLLRTVRRLRRFVTFDLSRQT